MNPAPPVTRTLWLDRYSALLDGGVWFLRQKSQHHEICMIIFSQNLPLPSEDVDLVLNLIINAGGIHSHKL